MEEANIIWAFLLTLGAGLSTGIGSFIGFFAKKTHTRFLSFSLGFSAGVMIYVSLIEIFPKAQDAFKSCNNDSFSYLWAFLFFMLGIFIIAMIDKIIPSAENPHEIKGIKDLNKEVPKSQKLKRMGVLTAIAITIHNFPEGVATFFSALQSPSLGLPIAIAIALHNIPEGIAVSVPIYYATKSRKKAFAYSFLSGLAEPLGAILSFLFLMPFFTPFLFGAFFAAVAGIMVFISLDELLPAAREYGHHHVSIYGVVSGMAVMGLSLFWLN